MFDQHRFFRGAWRESPFQKGDLKYVILDMIKDKPRYGYEIIRALEERSHGFYTPSPGVVYPTLQMLEEMGYINGIEQDGKKVYSITKEGLQFLTERKASADEIRSHLRHHWNPENVNEINEIWSELRKFRILFGSRFYRINPNKMRRIKEVISQAYSEIEKIVEEKEANTEKS
jgi:DNA-binding PadR family transcriptional regulator